jgi:hypothetical protein
LGRLLIVSITLFSAFSLLLVILPTPGCTYRIAGFFNAAYCLTFVSIGDDVPSLASKVLILLSFCIIRVLSRFLSSAASSSFCSANES